MSSFPQSRRIRSCGRLALATLTVALAGCAAGPSKMDAQKVQEVDTKSQPLIKDRIIEESRKMLEMQNTLREQLEQQAALPLQPVVPVYNPLDAVNITIQADAVDVRNVFKAIADQAGLNLVLPATLSRRPRTLSLSLVDVPASQAFEQVLKALDMNGDVKDGMLLVDEYEERVFDLDFLLTMSTVSYGAGGDVFGSSSSGDSSDSSSGDSGLFSNFSVSGRNTNDVNPYLQIEQMLATIIDREPESSEEDEAGDSAANGNRSRYMLNHSTGTLFVRARPSEVAAVSRLVEHYKSVLGRQVLIEAQILDVELSDEFSYGVDWSLLRGKVAASYSTSQMSLGDISSTLGSAASSGRSVIIPSTTLGTDGTSSLALAASGSDYNIGLDMLQTFGVVHILSNPSIRVRNTQPAVVSVGSNIRYISETSSDTENATAGVLSTSSSVETANVFDGVVMGVIPFISEDGSIHLTINPMQTSVDDSSLDLIDVGSETNPMMITLPEVEFKGMTTSLTLNSGDIVILGGLISESGSNSSDGLPGISDIPVLSKILGGTYRSSGSRELVLILRVQTI